MPNNNKDSQIPKRKFINSICDTQHIVAHVYIKHLFKLQKKDKGIFIIFLKNLNMFIEINILKKFKIDNVQIQIYIEYVSIRINLSIIAYAIVCKIANNYTGKKILRKLIKNQNMSYQQVFYFFYKKI